MKKKITVIDYGFGNLLSVKNAFEFCGAEVSVSNSYNDIKQAEYLVLPGVGAFRDAMKELKRLNLDSAIKEFALSQRPFLGICLGMQMMLECSKEFGQHEGLGLIKGVVDCVEDTDINGVRQKIPHIGWTPISPPISNEQWIGTILNDTQPDASFYFVHSFTAFPEKEENLLAQAFYNGRRITGVIKAGNFYGCQFHPEKSGTQGLSLLNCFISL